MKEEKTNKTGSPSPATVAAKRPATKPVRASQVDHVVKVNLVEKNGQKTVVVAPEEVKASPGDWVYFLNQAPDCDLIIVCTMEKTKNQPRKRGSPFTNRGYAFNPEPRVPFKIREAEGDYKYSAYLLDADGVLHVSDPSIIIRPR
jgi:hypothetical protein